ncbi:hypothetical protein ACIBCR_10175 [Micromonospora echinospora]|uniref:hypothetical protein n=1 Tax=Micromonospora echinospora TaxID=1877 RepID=UPI0037877377
MTGLATAGLAGPLVTPRAAGAATTSTRITVSLPADILRTSVPVNLDTARHGSAFARSAEAVGVVSELRLGLLRDRLIPGVPDQRRAFERLVALGVRLQAISAFAGDDEETVARRVAVAARWPRLLSSFGYEGTTPSESTRLAGLLTTATRARPGLHALPVREHREHSARPDGRNTPTAAVFQPWFAELDQSQATLVAPRAWLSQVRAGTTPTAPVVDHGWTLFGESGLVRTGRNAADRWQRTGAFGALRNLLRLATDPAPAGPWTTAPSIRIDAPDGVDSLAMRTRDGRLVVALWRPVRPGSPVTGGAELPVRLVLDRRAELASTLPSVSTAVLRRPVGDSWDLTVGDHALICTINPERA